MRPNFSTVLPAGLVLCTFMQYLIAFSIRQKVASEITSDNFARLIDVDKRVKFGVSA